MIRFRSLLRILAFVTLLLVGLLVLALAATQTAWFKDWLRRYVSREAEQYLNARLVIGKLDGNLLTGIELEKVSLVQNGETVISAKDIGLDPKMVLARQYEVRGLPVSFVLDRSGAVVGRALGSREWDSPAAHGLVTWLLARGPG